jgi:hypothetical protein
LAVFESEVGRGEIKLNSICLDWEVAIRAEIFGIWGGYGGHTEQLEDQSLLPHNSSTLKLP